MADNLQVFREIDKLDKIGAEGVRAMLLDGRVDESGAFVPGVGLHTFQADFILACITPGDGALGKTPMLVSRINLMAAMEERVADPATGETHWDRLLALPANADNSWAGGGRPANIGWALDDIIEVIRVAMPDGGR
jgi:hypothetical protein